MAKRARGSTSRPGQRAPIMRTPARPATPGTPARAATTGTPPPARAATTDIDLNETALDAYEGSSLTDADLARAAELEAQIVAEEKSAGAKQQTRVRNVATPRAGSTLAAAAANEYAYVARDVRRIVLIGGSLIALLFAGWAVVQVTGVTLV